MGFLLSLHSACYPACSQLHSRSSAPFVPILAYNWMCSWSTLSHIGALEATISLWSKRRTLLPERLLAAPGLLPQPLPSSMILPKQPLLIQNSRESLFKSCLCPWDLRVSSDTKRRLMRPEEEPICDSWESTPSHVMLLSLPSASTRVR